MKTFLKSLFSDSGEVSHKRIISIISFLVLIGMVILVMFKYPVNEHLVYVFAGLTGFQSGMTVIDKIINKDSNNTNDIAKG